VAGLHLIKLSVGTESVEDLRQWHRQRQAREGRIYHRTRMHPKREALLLAGGSIYWVIKGLILCRQELKALERIRDSDGRAATDIVLEPDLIEVEPRQQRAFQGWRYLEPKDAPRDLALAAGSLPPALAAELRALGCW